MMCVREGLVTGTAAWMVVLGLICESALGRGVILTVHPQSVSAEASKYALLPPAAALTDGDAVALYRKAVQMLPDQKSDEQVQQYLEMPVVLSGMGDVEQVLKRYLNGFECLTQAVKCRNCRWPAEKPETVMPSLVEYRRLAFAVRLWARHEIAKENYEGAILALQTGFGMGRHLTQDSTLLEFVLGQGIVTMMRTEVEAFVQAKDAPNLYAALAALPKPFLDVEKAIAVEDKTKPSMPPVEGVARELFEIASKEREQMYKQIRTHCRRLDRDLAAWQCVEAIRSYAASHAGQLPQTLADIKDVSLPIDPMTGAPFRYTQTDAVAVLESPAPVGSNTGKDSLYYEIAVQN